jgi:hypothetical protein
MRESNLRWFFVILYLTTYISAFSQERTDSSKSVVSIIDSLKKNGVITGDNLKKPEIILSNSQAVKFLQHKLQPQYWNDPENPFRQALGQLIFEASHPLYDTAEYILKNYPYDSLRIPWKNFYIWEPLRLKIPSKFIPEFILNIDSAREFDTNVKARLPDSIKNKQLLLPKLSAGIKPPAGLKDTTIMVIIDTLNEVKSAYSRFPFKYFSLPYQGDSIEVAVKSLLKYLEERDSSIIRFTGVGNVVTPVWMNSKSDKIVRYWLKNEFSDSVTIWIGNPSRNTVGLFLEQGVNFRRPVKQGNYADAKINIASLDNSKLQNVQKIFVKPQYWKYRTEASFVLSQASLTNWVKGGENSISTALDVTEYGDYENKALKLTSNNFARIKFGYMKSGTDDIRKNLDLLETNSKLNHKAFGKFDFSAIMLFKTQVAPGYNYPNDSVPVSKFMNPAILTIGFGLDYKPNKTTSLNISPLSYKGTFVLDTAHIDQTLYGIPRNRKSLNEPGVSFMVTNEYKPTKNISIVNRLQLFTNYIHNPQNVDVDWEMIAVANLNWFTDVRLDTHLIFDDDTKTVELDKHKNPILRPDGTPMKTARPQFKEMLGLSLAFRF